MTFDQSESSEYVDASSLSKIQALARHLGITIGDVHQIWCKHVWDNGARFVVLPGALHGKGMGVVAARQIKIEAGEQIVHIPRNLLYTTNSVPSDIKRRYSKITVHGLLACSLAHESRKDSGPYALWMKTWPSFEDLETSMPLLLDPTFREPRYDKTGRKYFILPPSIQGTWIDSLGNLETKYESSGLLPKQEFKFGRGRPQLNGTGSKPNPRRTNSPLDEKTFAYMWLIVNTRSFYYDLSLRTQPRNKDDKMCLCPFIDYFNHSDQGCNVAYNDEGFTVTANKDYVQGEEVFISYGAHSNDLLWTDYGFLLDDNASDSLCIDAWVLDESTGIGGPESRITLENAGYWRNYSISRESPCYRTEMAIRTQTLSRANWIRLANGENIKVPDQKIEQDTREFFVEKILKPCIQTCKIAQEAIRSLEAEMPLVMYHFALKRWKQMQLLAENCV